jgi:Domain of Unknown Function with PDB structure (DUF3857)/Transglutaminase-like superfamily
MKNALLSLCISLFASPSLVAQTKPQKWGVVSPEDLQMTVYTPDSAAKAVILQDIGSMFVFYDDTKGPSTRMMRQRRIKILHKDAFEEGNIFIPYHTKSQDISDLRALVTSPSGQQTKVKSENIFSEKRSDFHSAKKIFFPNLEVGSVVEYGYTLEEESIFSPDTWYFQDAIPTRFSQLEFEYPEKYQYVTIKAYGKAAKYESAKVTNREYGRGYGQEKAVYSITEFDELPAIKEEEFMTTANDYRCRLGFQLKTYENHLGMIVPVFSDWILLAKELEEDMQFGKQYNSGKYANDILKAFQTEVPDPGKAPDQIAQSALGFLTKHIKWNKNYNYVPTGKSLDEAFKKKQGNAGDLNLSLIALLRALEIEAYPILMSTRGHGEYIDAYPVMTQFNSVIVGVIADGKLTIYDATSPYHSANLVNYEHANYHGWMVRKDSPGWVEVKPINRVETIFFKGNLTPELDMEGEVALRLGGRAGVRFREMHAEQTNTEFLKKRYIGKFAEVTINDVKVEGSDYTKPVSVTFQARFAKAAQSIGEVVYVPIMIEKFFDENPFKSLKRTFPVQFPFPMKSDYVINLTIPEGYVIDYIPEATKLVIEDGGPTLLIAASKVSESEVQVRMNLLIKNLNYVPEHYTALRDFFTALVEKQDQQIVLKKK